MSIDITVITPLFFAQNCSVYTQAIDPIYGTITGAENYFKGKIKESVRDWTDSDDDDKMAALRSATQIIESLNLIGTSIGTLHFPTSEHGLPIAILKACYEIALKLISGIDPDIEANNLSANAQGYAGARKHYDRSFVQEHIRAGVPSAFAWTILRPYVCDPLGLILSRGS